MFIPQSEHVPTSFDVSSIVPLPLDKHPRVSLDMSGVAGLVGGADALSAMTAVHVYGNRRLLGWYNTPGSFQLAKQFRWLAKATSSQSVHVDPFTLCDSESNHCKGPTFRAAHSGTAIEETSEVAALFAEECAAWDSEGKVVPGRKTQPVGITVADLGRAPASEIIPARRSASTLFFASAPIATSVGACALCVACRDWYASGLILIGIVASGVSSLALGSANFIFTHPEPATGSPAGDGILGSGKDMVLLKGAESAVNAITRGRFALRFASKGYSYLLWWCSVLFFVQAVAQLLLVPQASLFGQLMFLASLAVSALYNAWLSSMDKEKVHRKLLFEQVLENPRMTKYTLGTHTAAVVFVLLVLQPQDPSKLLDELLPNDTKVWTQWKATISEELRHASDGSFLPQSRLGHVDGFTQQEQDLLALLYGDARAAHDGYRDYVEVDSS